MPNCALTIFKDLLDPHTVLFCIYNRSFIEKTIKIRLEFYA